MFSESREGIFRDFAVSNPAALETKEKLVDFLRQLSTDQLVKLASKFQYLPLVSENDLLAPAAKKRKINQESTLPSFPPKFSDNLFQKDMIIKVTVFTIYFIVSLK